MKKIIVIILSILIIATLGYVVVLNNSTITSPSQATIYCVSNNCIAQQSGALTQECFKDINSCTVYDWKIFIDEQNGIQFKYPEDFGENVWRPIVWPPKTNIVSENKDPVTVGCSNIQLNNGATEKDISINNINYKYYFMSDVGAGSVYNDYCYITQKDQKYYVVDFNIRYHSGCYDGGCGAYCETPNEIECRNFNLIRDVENPIKLIMSTVVFIK
jgi:hypothetical protein